jgi:hypothetical protein
MNLSHLLCKPPFNVPFPRVPAERMFGLMLHLVISGCSIRWDSLRDFTSVFLSLNLQLLVFFASDLSHFEVSLLASRQISSSVLLVTSSKIEESHFYYDFTPLMSVFCTRVLSDMFIRDSTSRGGFSMASSLSFIIVTRSVLL